MPRLGGFYLQLRFLCGDGGTFFRYRVTLDGCRIAPVSAAPRKACLPTRQSPLLMCASQARPALFQARGKPFSAGPRGRACVSNTDRRHRPRLAGNAFRCIRWRDEGSMAQVQKAGICGMILTRCDRHNAFKPYGGHGRGKGATPRKPMRGVAQVAPHAMANR